MNRPRIYRHANGSNYDLSHLSPVLYQCTTTNIPEGVVLLVKYSSHCFTVGTPTAGETFPTYRFEGEPRYFCTARHNFSLGLPTLMQGAIDRATTFKVFQTYDRNGAVNYALLEDVRTSTTYTAFFDIKRDQDPASKHQILLFVKSAYVNDRKHSPNDAVRLGTLIDRNMGKLRRLNHKKKRRKK